MLTVKENNPLDTHNAGGDFFNFFHKSDPQAQPGFSSLQCVARIHRHVHDGDLFGRGAQEHHNPNGFDDGAVMVKGEERLSLMIADLDNDILANLLNARVAKLSEGVNDAFAHQVLSGVEKHEFFKRFTTGFGNR